METEGPKTYKGWMNKWNACTLCPIASDNKVLYRGSMSPEWLFIGEAPGPSEAVVGIPFVGPSGKVLTSLLDGVIGKSIKYGITNTICCFPKQEDEPTKFRVPEKQEMLNCRQHIDELIEILSPKRYIALGKTALKNPPTGIEYHLALDHPSYILRCGGIGSLHYKRNMHSLRKFYERFKNGKA